MIAPFFEAIQSNILKTFKNRENISDILNNLTSKWLFNKNQA